MVRPLLVPLLTTLFDISLRKDVFCVTHVLLLGLMSFINLVDPASSHMLVSKIKPCMSKFKLLYGETANGSLKQLQFI